MYVNFFKIDGRVFKLGEVVLDVFYYAFECYRIGFWMGFVGFLGEKNYKNILIMYI